MSLSVEDSGAGLALPYYDRSSALRATFHHSHRRTNATAAAALNGSMTNARRARAKAQLMPLPPPSPPSAVSLVFICTRLL